MAWLADVVPQQGLTALLELLPVPPDGCTPPPGVGAVQLRQPPNSQRAFWRPSLRLSRLSLKQSVPVSQSE